MRPQVKSTLIWSLLGLSVALNAALVTGFVHGAAEKAPCAPPAGDDHCLLDRLDLDAEQKRRLAEMRRKMHEKRDSYRERASAIKAKLAEAISASRANRDALDALLERYAGNQAAMQRAVAEHLLGVCAMLRPEQREEFRLLLRTEMFRGIRSSWSTPAGAP